MSAPALPHPGPGPVDLGHGIHLVDADFLGLTGSAACYILVEHGRAAVIETGTAHTVPRILSALEQLGLGRDRVDWVIVTHVHLDHAGGAGALLTQLPAARLAVHPRGARHLKDPSKLVAGATAVYGAEFLAAHYGEVVPVPEARVVETPEGFGLELAGRRLRFADTPGHAQHHACIWDEASAGWFTGDTFGLSYRWTDTDAGPFVWPTTSPVQLDPPALHRSIDRLAAAPARACFLTHYGRIEDPARHAPRLHRLLDGYVTIALRHAGAPDLHERLRADLERLLLEDLRAHGCDDDPELRQLLGMDLELNAQGLAVWLGRR